MSRKSCERTTAHNSNRRPATARTAADQVAQDSEPTQCNGDEIRMQQSPKRTLAAKTQRSSAPFVTVAVCEEVVATLDDRRLWLDIDICSAAQNISNEDRDQSWATSNGGNSSCTDTQGEPVKIHRHARGKKSTELTNNERRSNRCKRTGMQSCLVAPQQPERCGAQQSD